MTKKTLTLLAFMVVGITNAYGAPVYLKCAFSDSGVFDVTLDESNMKVLAFGKIVDGGFGPDTVSFLNNMSGSAHAEYVINRVDLSFKETYTLSLKTREGSCKIIKAPKNRAF